VKSMGLVRLQKVLAQAGVASRRTAERMILAGKVKVDGITVTELGAKVDPEVQKVEYEGKSLQTEKTYTYVFNKPAGMITTMNDPQGRACVGDILKALPARVYPVGRLDYDSSGLLICTNDGELANRLIHPRYKLEKVYRVWVQGSVEEEMIKAFKSGVRLAEGWTLPAKAIVLGKINGNTHMEICLKEGKNRQIRRMCETLGHPVISLCRIRVGTLSIKGLATGCIRELTAEEIYELKKATGL
jgi:23S rRNA pseudouridine2605 synthase